MGEILSINHLTKRFSGLVAVNDLSLSVKKRSIHTLIGPNGAGKSTTINLITGVIKGDTGNISFDGRDITKEATYKIAQMGLGRTFQNIKLFGAMTVIDNLMVGAHKNTSQGMVNFLWNIKRARQEEEKMRTRSETVLKQMDLYQYKDEMVNSLPYGLRKMTELGRTLMTEPKMILLDEPAAGLNPSERQEFIQKLRGVYDSGVDLFLIEHNMDIVMSISDYITVINFGAKIAEGTPEEVVNNPEVIKAYLGDRFKAD
jgi:ABC-type branched-chain amino acid transport systems, ATPase component